METNNISDLKQRFTKLFSDGKLIQLHICRWSMTCQLNEKDLELKEGAEIPEFVSLGSKNLVDPEIRRKFERVDASARAYLKRNSWEFPISQAHFVPNKKLPDVLAKLKEFEKAYDEVTAEFLRDYEVMKQTMLTKYSKHRDILEPYYPTLERLKYKFSFFINMFEVVFPETMGNTTMAEYTAQLAATDELQSKFKAEMASQYEQSKSLINQFLHEAVEVQRKKIVDTLTTMQRKLANKEVLSKTNLTSFDNLVTLFNDFNFLNDQAIAQELTKVSTLLHDPDRDFRCEGSTAELRTAVDELMTAAQNISDVDKITGEYMRSIEL